MINQSDAELGTTVYLRPFTKVAPPECYRRLPAVVVSYERWPMVRVRVFDVLNNGHGRELTVHRDNIGLRRKTIKRDAQGDGQNQQDASSGMIGKVMGKAKPLAPSSDYEEPMLF